MKMHPILFLFLAFALITGCEKAAKPKRPPPAVSVGVVSQQDVPVYFDSIGQVIPPVTVQIRPQVGGKLLTTYVVQGDEVKANQILYEIDPRPFQAALEQAKAVLEKDEALLAYAEKAQERYAKVVEEDFISKLTFEQYESNTAAARAQVATDKAAVVQAALNVEFTQVVAPIDGKISFFAVDTGNIVIADDPIALTVIRPHEYVDISFSITQQQFELVRQHQGDAGEWEFLATLPEVPLKDYSGKSYFINNELAADTGTILIKGRLENFKRELWPGEFIKVKLLQNIAKGALTVPPGAILIGRNGHYVYVLEDDGKVAVKLVKVIYRTEEYIAIESESLAPGQTVITDGQLNIAPGMTVNVIQQPNS